MPKLIILSILLLLGCSPPNNEPALRKAGTYIKRQDSRPVEPSTVTITPASIPTE
ncbi:MAG: hypothetical protein AAFY54_12850 [Cyanobacteria bacterium J06648_10]